MSDNRKEYTIGQRLLYLGPLTVDRAQRWEAFVQKVGLKQDATAGFALTMPVEEVRLFLMAVLEAEDGSPVEISEEEVSRFDTNQIGKVWADFLDCNPVWQELLSISVLSILPSWAREAIMTDGTAPSSGSTSPMPPAAETSASATPRSRN